MLRHAAIRASRLTKDMRRDPGKAGHREGKSRSPSKEERRKMTYCLRSDEFAECLAAIVLNEESDLDADEIEGQIDLPGVMKEATPPKSTSEAVQEDRTCDLVATLLLPCIASTCLNMLWPAEITCPNVSAGRCGAFDW